MEQVSRCRSAYAIVCQVFGSPSYCRIASIFHLVIGSSPTFPSSSIAAQTLFARPGLPAEEWGFFNRGALLGLFEGALHGGRNGDEPAAADGRKKPKPQIEPSWPLGPFFALRHSLDRGCP